MTETTLGLDFSLAKAAVARQFKEMQKHQLYRVAATQDEMWALYLGSFPPGTNPVFRERTEHDCSCCRHFIRDIGNVIAIIDGKIATVWDQPTRCAGYDAVFAKLRDLILSKPIADVFMHSERSAGVDKNYEGRGTDNMITWNHFHVDIAPAFVAARKDIPSLLSVKRSAHDVLARAFKELTVDALDQFLELTAQGSLYRGEEFKGLVQKFRAKKLLHDMLIEADQDVFVWETLQQESGAFAHIRNSAVGTLLVNLSEGTELEVAVRAYESVVAPQNYKRPTALVTKDMIAKAKLAIEGLGLTTALERRHAVLSDISVNNVLFADRSAKKVMQDVFDEIATQAPKKTAALNAVVEEVPIDRFIADVLPKIEAIEVMMENRHSSNLVSLIAPADPAAGLLFKWPNPFSWSYAGEVTDSIKERVKAAGGAVTGDLCCRLAWFNYDDLDFHMKGPGTEHVYFATRHSDSLSGGRLDVDMNAGSGHTRTPVENIVYRDSKKMRPGTYTLIVNQYNNRDKTDPGFEVEVELLGTRYNFSSAVSPRTSASMEVVKFIVAKDGNIEVKPVMDSTMKSKDIWGVKTQEFQRVNVMMLSPNHWDDAGVGNKHYFFMLDSCANDGSARGFFNEFLTPSLDAHRKVFEIVGSKMKPAPASEQLSGLGFSSTQRNTLLCRVKGSFTRTIKIIF